MIVATETTSVERTGPVVELSLRDRIRAGDPEAFAELFGAHARAVYGHAARLSPDRGTAEDVVSLTFLEAWRLREKLRPEAAALDEDADVPEGDGLRPWLYGIATNVLRMRTSVLPPKSLRPLPPCVTQVLLWGVPSWIG